MKAAAAEATAAARISLQDCKHFEIYSCFPVAVQVAVREMGIPFGTSVCERAHRSSCASTDRQKERARERESERARERERGGERELDKECAKALVCHMLHHPAAPLDDVSA